jgi:hypothetical protein
MPSEKGIPKTTKAAIRSNNLRRELEDLLMDWPEGEGKEKLKNLLSKRKGSRRVTRASGGKVGGCLPKNSATNAPILGGEQPKKSSLPQSQQQQPEQTRGTLAGLSSRSRDSWRLLKSLDIIGYNQGAERAFVEWLIKAIKEQPEQSVSISWVKANAAYKLDLSPETIKRYIIKHTSDYAPFVSEGGALRLRADDEFPPF